MLRVLEIMAFKHVPGTSVNSDKNTFYRKLKCYQRVLRFYICLKEMLSNSICLGIMEYSDESTAILISAVFRTHKHVDAPKVV